MKRTWMMTAAAFVVAVGGVWAANEITASIVLRVVDGSLDISRQASTQFSVTNDTPQYAGGTVSVSTNASAAISTSPVNINGWAYFRNLDSTNVANRIEIGVTDGTNFYPFSRLKPNEYGCIRLAPGVAIHAKSIWTAGAGSVTNASSRLEKFIVDD